MRLEIVQQCLDTMKHGCYGHIFDDLHDTLFEWLLAFCEICETRISQANRRSPSASSTATSPRRTIQRSRTDTTRRTRGREEIMP